MFKNPHTLMFKNSFNTLAKIPPKPLSKLGFIQFVFIIETHFFNL